MFSLPPKRRLAMTMTSFAKLYFALLTFASTSLFAQSGSTYYVSTNGSDTNSGSYTAPWLTIQHAANTVTAGATVYVESGVYNESVSFPSSGTASEPITFASYPGETAPLDRHGLARCRPTPPSSGTPTEGLLHIVNHRYITVTGFEIRNFTN